MRALVLAAAYVVAVLLSGCRPERLPAAGDDTWVGTIAVDTDYLNHLATLRGGAPPASEPLAVDEPAFMGLLGAVTEETWVLRQGPGFKLPDCDDRPARIEDYLAADPCWQEALSHVTAATMDEAGTIRVKRYRIVPPARRRSVAERQ